MSTIIAIANQKGGVGKTTTSINLSAYLARLGEKVLLLDLDPQGNSTGGLGLDKNEIKSSLYNILVEGEEPSGVVNRTKTKGLDVIPSNPILAAAEIELVRTLEREHRLKFALEKVTERYDIVIIDCPPSLGLLTVNGLTAADHILIPVQSEYYSLEGLGQLIHTIRLVRAKLNPDLDIIGIVATMFDRRTTLSYQVLDELKKHFGDKLFKTTIPRNIRLAEAPSFGETIAEYDRWSSGASAYKHLAKELIERVKNEPAIERGVTTQTNNVSEQQSTEVIRVRE